MEYIQVGQIINTHGLKGELKAMPLTNFLDRFQTNGDFYIGNNHDKVHLTSARQQKGNLILKFAEFNSIDEVIKYKGTYLFVSEEDQWQLPKDHYYVHQLKGLAVKDENGKPLGKLTDVIETGGNDVYAITNDAGKTMYIPAVREFIKRIAIEENMLIVKLIDGMQHED